MKPLLTVGGALALGLAAAALARLPFANGPAEWEWAWRQAGLDAALGWWAGAVLSAAFLVGVGWAAATGRLGARAVLPLLVLCGWLFTLALAAIPDGFDRIAASLASRHSFGYLWDAALAPSARELLADYPRVSRGLNQHARTHPPGALLAVRAVDGVGRRLERIVPPGDDGLLADARRALERERQRASARGRPLPPSLPSSWTILLLAALLPALSALAALPLHALALRLGLPSPAALFAAALWMLVPARSLFTPSLDQALPLLVVGAAALASGEGWVRKVGAGVLLALACFISYGALAVVPLVAAGVWRGSDDRARPLAAFTAGFAVPWLAVVAFAGYAPWAAFTSAMQAHRAIAVAPRGYFTWLLWNPYDFALLLGPAVALLALGALALPRVRPVAIVLWGTLALLLLSGGVRGEVGRIWLPFMPWACALAAAVPTRRAPALLALQALLTCVLAATMVFIA